MESNSQWLADRFQLRLTTEATNWFDKEWQTISGSGMSFNEAIDPKHVTESIWGGLMPPDTLPIAGNGCGDCLLARFGQDGALNEIIAWYHEGGGWTHFGTTIQEAVNFDRAMYPFHLDDSLPPATLSTVISRIAACEHTSKQALESPLLRACRKHGGGRLAKSVGVDWPAFKTWLHDPSRIPAPILEKLASRLNTTPHDLVHQDWNVAVACAQAVMALRHDLAWPYAVTGWAYEREGKVVEAISVYAFGVFAPGSSASFTELWTLGPKAAFKKFCVHRLLTLTPRDLPSTVQEYLQEASRNREREYWIRRATLATEAGNHQESYHHLYAAGWDAFSTNDGALLEMMAEAAGRANAPTLQSLANAHLETLH